MKIFKDLRFYLKAYSLPYILGSFYIAVSVGFMVFRPRLIQRAVDSLETGVNMNFLAGSMGILLLITLGRDIFLFLARRTMIFASRHIENDLRNDFFRHLQILSPGFFHANPTGDLMAVATNDLAAVRQVLGPGIMYSVNTLLSSLLIVTNLILYSPLLTLLAMFILPFMAFAVYRFGKSIHWRFEKIQEQYGVLTTRTQENLSGVRVIRSYVQEDHERELFRQANQEYVNRNKGYLVILSAFRPALSAIMGVGTMVLLLAGGEMIIRDRITIGEFTAFSIYLGMLIWPAIAIGWVTGLFQRGTASMKRILRILDTQPLIRDHGSAQAMEGEDFLIEIRNLNFRYTPGGALVLRNVNASIKPGTTFAVIGPTGSGKSTLINLLARLYPLERGQILINGRDINDIELESLRRLFGFVPQETFLFSETIGSNIAFACPDASKEEITAAADLASMGNEIREFPKGLDTLLGEKGINLSGGQKQRTAIARAVLKDPRILVLDDAFSSVDTHTEERILENIRKFAGGRTLILISHRITTVRHADHILVLQDGAVVEEGTHEDLLRKGGLYADLNEQQRLKSELEEF